MKTKVVCAQIEKTEALEKIAQDRIDHVLEKFADAGILSSVVRLQMDHAFLQKGKEHFRVEILLKTRRLKDIVLKKTGENMYEALADAAHKLNQMMSRLHTRKIKESRRKLRLADRRMKLEFA